MGNGVVLSNLEDIPSELTTFGSRMVVDADEAEHEECRSTHEHECELHCGVVLAARSPDTDEKVHGNKCDLIEHEHGEEVDGDEETKYSGGEKNEPKEESLGLGDGPRSE